MNVYDQAHGLAQAIKMSEEYKQYEGAKAKINENNPWLNYSWNNLLFRFSWPVYFFWFFVCVFVCVFVLWRGLGCFVCAFCVVAIYKAKN